MNARTLEDLEEFVLEANRVNDDVALEQYANELDFLATSRATALAEYARGRADHLVENFTEALEHYGHALGLYSELDDRRGLLVVTINVGRIHYRTESYPTALEYYNRALAFASELDDRGVVADAFNSLGNVHNITGDYPAALDNYNKALALRVELGQRGGEAHVTGNLGTVYYYTSDYPTALRHFNAALALHSELGDLVGVASVTGNIGNVYYTTGDYATALENYNKALELSRQIGDRSGIAHHLGSIGQVYKETAEYSTALEYYQSALAMYRELGEGRGEATTTARVLQTLLLSGAHEDARLTLAELDVLQLDEPHVVVMREVSRAALHVLQDDIEAAQTTLISARDYAMSRGIRADAADVYLQLRDLAQRRNDLASYIEYNNEFTRIKEDTQGKETSIKLAMQAKEREITEREKETAKHLAVLHSALPKHIADRVARGETVTDHFDNAAVLFLDVVGFTTHSSTLDAGIVVQLLQDMFTTFDAICAEHNVMKIKTIGDSYMAVAFGTANAEQRTANVMPSEVEAQRAANTEQRIANVARTMMASEFMWPHTGERVIFRIGIHCGPVVAGVLGTERMQYDVWGDTVNVASRMESSSEPGRIQISEALANALHEHKNSPPVPLSHASLERGSYTVIPRGTVDVKGKGMMQTYWLEMRES